MTTIFQGMLKTRIRDYIDKQPIMPIQFHGNSVIGKWIEGADVIVKVIVNLHEQGFLNRDICRVLAELDYEKVLIKRLEDGYEGIVEKRFLKFPKWEKYDL